MSLPSFILVFLLSLSALPRQAWGRQQCTQVFTSVRSIGAQQIRFTQGLIGVRWAKAKKARYKVQYESRKEDNPQYTKRQYIQDKFSEKPIPAIRDIQGQTRIIDNHHKLYALTKLYGRELDFPISVRIVRDYTLPVLRPVGPRYWTRERMMQDLVSQSFVSVQGARTPSYAWLKGLPSTILAMGNLPTRSLMSFVMQSFPVGMTGGDFAPHIQNQLGRRMEDMGIELFRKRPWQETNINRLREEIFNRPELIEFLIQRLRPEGEKFEEILEMLDGHRASENG